MIVLCVVLLVSGALFILIGVYLRNYLKRTAGDWKNGTGTITGYQVEDYSSRDVPLVEFWDNEEKILASASSVLSREKPAAGSEVQIKIRKNEFKNRKPTYQVIIKTGQEEGKRENILIGIIVGIGLLQVAGGAVLLISILAG